MRDASIPKRKIDCHVIKTSAGSIKQIFCPAKSNLFIYYLKLRSHLLYTTLDPRPMSALAKFTDAFFEQFPDITEEQRLWAANFIEEDSKQFKALKDTGKFTFGRWKGYSVAELAQTPKGLEYVQWCLQQAWFEESKFPTLYADITRLNIKKKKFVKAPLI